MVKKHIKELNRRNNQDWNENRRNNQDWKENRRNNQDWTIQRNRQHWTQDTEQSETK
jgi:hypothetical protein